MGVITKGEVAAVRGAVAVEGAIAEGAFTPLVEGGGLASHEGPALGHTIARHVGLNATALDARIADEGLKMASSFASRAEAETAGSAVMSQNAGKIANWVTAGAKAKLELDGAFTGGIMRVVGGYDATASGARFVLRGNGTGGYFILTGFPTP